MAKRGAANLRIHRFAQIDEADIELGDLTIFVGAQATGKSLALQLFKLCADGRRVTRELADNGFSSSSTVQLIENVFGEGMAGAWGKGTRVSLGSKALSPQSLSAGGRKPSSPHEVFYIPAQRALTIADGWPMAFRAGPLGTPYVVRRFSEGLADVLRNAGPGGKLFPLEGKLKESLRQMIDEAFFHGARLELHTTRARTELRLAVEGGFLPTMAWTAGQREFVPLLVALYSLLPSGKKTKDDAVEWIVLEEPEMGLHPKAILAVMLLVLELLARGYKVILSTHHPLVLDVVWGLRQIQESRKLKGRLSSVLELFGQEGAWQPLHGIAREALDKRYKVWRFYFDESGVLTEDISSLYPGSDNKAIAGWGGLSGLSAHIGDVVADVVSS